MAAASRPEQPVLKTRRLLLRPFTTGDGPEVRRLAGDRAIADNTLNIPHPYEEGMAEDWIATHRDDYRRGTGVVFALTLRSDGSLVGAISLMDISAGHRAELGYWIGRPFWGRGYCTEAARAVLDYAFGELGLERVHASYFQGNESSGRVMRKLGMSYEGCRRRHVRKGRRLIDLELYGILREDWTRGTVSGTASA
jgi:RimJ/RimL family protein N-acetyltransferase